MMSIYGRSATPPSPPGKHNHFVPDGYIPPKSRQKLFKPPSYAKMLCGGGPSPGRSQCVLPYAEFSRPPSRHETPVDRKATLRKMQKNFDGPRRVHSDHEHILKPSTPPLRGILKSSTPPRSILKPSSLRGILKHSASPARSRPRTPQAQQSSTPPQPPRSPQAQQFSRSPQSPQARQFSRSPQQQQFSTSPQGQQSSMSPHSRSPPPQQYCEVEDVAPPESRQEKGLAAGLRPPPSSDGSQSSYGPISVVDKYDTRDSRLWQPQYAPRRVPPAKSARGRPRVRNPNTIFHHVANAACSSKQEDDEEDEDADCCHEPCAPPLDWDRDPALHAVPCEERQAHRQRELEEYLREVCARQSEETFARYLIRCYAYANGELNANASKHILGYVDGHLSALDVWVLRLCRGTLSRLARVGTAYPNRDCELFLRLLREECVALDAERGSLLRRHLNETERRVSACNEQERNYKKILLLSQRSPMGLMQHLRRRDYR